MKGKKEIKNKSLDKAPIEDSDAAIDLCKISNRAELKNFLIGIRDKMTEEQSSPIYSVVAMNHVMNTPELCDFMDDEIKEIARDIWLRIKQSGLQLRNPPMLFGTEDEAA